MKYSAPKYIAAACATAALAGCVVAPVGMEPGYGGHGHVPLPAVVYVAPTYVMPGPGYVWQRHGRHGWGWHPRAVDGIAAGGNKVSLSH